MAQLGCSSTVAPQSSGYEPNAGYPTFADSQDAGVPERFLSASPTALHLQPGAQAELTVRVKDLDGDPVQGATVSFSLAGPSGDTGLTALTVVSDKHGAATNSLRAGELGADFELRVATVGADAVFIPVTVTPAGFGTLIGTANYAGAHTPSTLTLLAFEGGDCESLQRQTTPADVSLAERALELTYNFAAQDTAPTEISFYLPADKSYALLAQALGPNATVLASGCVAGIALEENSTATANVPLVDNPHTPEGTFNLTFKLDSSTAAAELGTHLRTALEARLLEDLNNGTETYAPTERGPLFLLNSLQSVLSESEDEATVTTQVATASHVTALDTYLGNALTGPDVAIEALVTAASDGLAELTVAGQIALAAKSTSTTVAQWTPGSVTGSPASASQPMSAPRFELDLNSANWEADTPEQPAGSLDFGEVRIPLPLGALGNQALRTFAGQGTTPTITKSLGCDALAAFWQERPVELQAAICDEACLAAACDRALSSLLTTAEQTLIGAEGNPSPLPETGTVSLQLKMRDPSGDLRPDILTATALECEWSPTPDNALSLPGRADGSLPPLVE